MEPITLRDQDQNNPGRITKRDMLFSLVFLVILFVVSPLLTREESDKDLLVWQEGSLKITCPDETVYDIPYHQITGIQLVEEPDFGTCISGESSGNYRYGIWENDTLGKYVLCTFKSFHTVIQIDTADQIYWIGYDSSESTRLLYQGFLDTLANQ